ncbi:MAG: AbrB/MazE/SpoVT family DNA-binding domain-containing protein [SAR324 cluster bacterium]|nr:AbrB/MazE/SpoVT family DNA-binding domain-containing protein [SAR324 cluster bacterium]
MLTKVKKWGNSQGVRIPKKMLDDVCLQVGEEIDISVEEGKIVIESTVKAHGRYNIHDLIRQMPAGYVAKEEDWGEPVGKEVW